MTLFEHRMQLSECKYAYSKDVYDNEDRLCKSIVPHLKNAGYTKVTYKRCKEILNQIVNLLFEVQDERPMFFIEGTQLPLCWNRPVDWNIDFIKYEWGHLKSKNQNKVDAEDIHNLALYSARCNQHIQSSMDIQELMIYGGILAQRINTVLISRRKLFDTEVWYNLLQQLEEYK